MRSGLSRAINDLRCCARGLWAYGLADGSISLGFVFLQGGFLGGGNVATEDCIINALLFGTHRLCRC